MKKPTPGLMIANPALVIESKIALWGFGKGYHLEYNLHINIYNRLNTKVCKRVLNGYKRLLSDIESEYQMVEKNIGIANIGGLRI